MKSIQIPLDKIEVNDNSRVIYKEADLSELMQSLKKNGQLQNIGVRPIADGKYDLVFGSRRFVAAKKLGWADLQANIIEADDENERDILGLVENIKRQNTSVMEDGRMFVVLKQRGLTHEEIASRLGVNEQRVTLAIEAYQHIPKEYTKTIVNRIGGQRRNQGEISATTAHAILNLRKAHGLNRKNTRKLLEYAKTNRANTQNVQQIAPLMAEGLTLTQALSSVGKLQRFTLFFFMNTDRVAKLEKKHGKPMYDILWDKLEADRELDIKRREKHGPDLKEIRRA